MPKTPAVIAEFLRGGRVAVAGVSRSGANAANAIFRKLRASGYEVLAVNPHASQVEGVECYPDLKSIPGEIDRVVVVTPPSVSATVVRQAVERGVGGVWFHRSFGQGSVSKEAVEECARHGLPCVVGGCPLMYCEPVDFAHRCIRRWLGWWGRVPR